MKEQTIRFGIRDGSQRAATWKIWSPITKADIYLSCRELKGFLKASLHESGSWHFGYTEEGFKKHFEQEESNQKSRHIEIWPRPKQIAAGVILAFRIVTPFSAVTTPIEVNSNKVSWIPNCQEELATEIDIIITSFDPGENNWPGKRSMGTNCIGTFKLYNGDVVWIIYWTIPMPDLSSLNNKTFRSFKGQGKAQLVSSNLRVIVFGDEMDGLRTLIDCVVNYDTN